MRLEVIVDKWGNYVKGDIILDMPESTALACMAHKVVKDLDAVDQPEEPVEVEDEVVGDSKEDLTTVETDEVPVVDQPEEKVADKKSNSKK